MSDILIQRIDDLTPHSGEHAIEGIQFRPAREMMGVSAWGMNVMDLAPGCTGYPTHDHAADGQEEIYVVLDGEGVLKVGDEEHVVAAGSMVRVPPEVTRSWLTRDKPMRLLALGGTPGKAYEPPSW